MTKTYSDNLAEDLERIIDESISDDALDFGQIDPKVLMEKLTIYLVDRDHKILQRGIELGQQKAVENVKK